MVVEQVTFAFSDHRLQPRPSDVFAVRLTKELLDECRIEVLGIAFPLPESHSRPGLGVARGACCAGPLGDSDVLTRTHQITVGEDRGPPAGLRLRALRPSGCSGGPSSTRCTGVSWDPSGAKRTSEAGPGSRSLATMTRSG